MEDMSKSVGGGTLPIVLRFNLFWAVAQAAGGTCLLALPVIVFAEIAKEGGRDPVVPSLVLFAMVALPIAFLVYFGLRGLSRRDQIVIGPDGLSGPLIAKHGGTVAWVEIADMQYKSRGFLESLRLRLNDGRRIVIRDLSQLSPVSLLEVSEAVKTWMI
jgi:hypothetical protein